ncbi:uncharacterized protein [Cicer arietinum]|uniref:Uncharacterized protein LOC101500711 n=1 Tax=Cicer arietinum TaxID=3827 RepID=A0A1S2YY28_CICAR|nr:uncharacterized protein LOC101500711 [Cicer arietinum]
MKLSLKFRNNNDGQNLQTTQTQIMTAKLPITVFNNPLLSTITATGNSSSDFSFSLSTNFPSGPTFKLSYSPTSSLPFSLNLKSGLGFFGSPRHSPLVFSANFQLSNLSSSTPLLLPSFFLHFKPQFGHFSLHKTVFSDSDSNTIPLSVSPPIEKGFVPLNDGSCSGWQNLNLEPFGHKEDNGSNNNNNVFVGIDSKNSPKCGLSPSFGVMARTVMPVTQGLLLNFRWGVNFPGKSGLKMPYLIVNKIRLERVEEVKNDERNSDNCEGDLKVLKGVKRDLENVAKENRELKRVLDEMKMRVLSSREKSNEKVGNKVPQKQHLGENESFKSWGSNKNERQENEKKQGNKSQNIVVVSDLESELEKAIKAVSS